MSKIVNLTVHKNNRDQIRRHRTSRNMVSVAKQLAVRKDVVGYALVSWNADEDAEVEFSIHDTKVSTNSLPEFVRGAISRKIGMMDNE